ncbi:MAG: glutamyl-tRNA reductase [Chloroflexi bacterium]|nr:glutamyl-tRNA reductase [Chloroflexota bacterium]
MGLAYVGVSHKTATTETLAAVAVTGDDLPEAIRRLTGDVGPGVILSTCNRTELYVDLEDSESAIEGLTGYLESLALAAGSGVDTASIRDAVRAATGGEAVDHLFRVAAGLDSMVIGDSQISGQLEKALETAAATTAVPVAVDLAIWHALRAARRVRSRSGLTGYAPSMTRTAVQLIESRVSDLSQLRVGVIGTGAMGLLMMSRLKRRGALDLTVVSRNPARAAQVASDFGARHGAINGMSGLLSDLDVVIACAAAREPIITARTLENVDRSGRLIVLDLSVPPAVAPDVEACDGVELLGLEDIEAIAQPTDSPVREAVARAEAIISDEIQRYQASDYECEAVPVIRALGQMAELRRVIELERALKQLPDADEQTARVIDSMSRALVKRLLADPIDFVRKSRGVDEVAEIYSLERPEHASLPAGDPDSDELPRAV